MISDYFETVDRRIREMKIIVDKSLDYKTFSYDEGMIRGKMVFLNGYVLEFMEYVCIGKGRPKYRFHLMDKDGKLIFRYDNAPHCKVSTFPHHKHTPQGVEESKEVGILDVLNEVGILILKKV